VRRDTRKNSQGQNEDENTAGADQEKPGPRILDFHDHLLGLLEKKQIEHCATSLSCYLAIFLLCLYHKSNRQLQKKGEKADHIPLFRLFSVGQDAEAYKR
jgi:hypothetical protein